MKIIDLHCDTIMRFYIGQHLKTASRHINLEKLQKGGCMAQCFAIFVPTGGAAARHGITGTAEEYFDKAYTRYLEELELCKDTILPAYTAKDIETNFQNGKLSAVLTVEDSVTLDGKIERVDDYFKKGVRMATLTWNYENSLGYPQSKDGELHMRGLKPFGFEVVERMNELGIAVDVSHLSEGGFWDVAKTSKKPFIASHSCSRTLCDVSRNLTDEQLRALADSGGVCGINFATDFLRKNAEDNYTRCEDVARHLLYMKNVAGIDTLALGSDYDGIGSELEWGDAGGNGMLVDSLRGSFTDDEIEKICWKNALRAFKDIIGE